MKLLIQASLIKIENQIMDLTNNEIYKKLYQFTDGKFISHKSDLLITSKKFLPSQFQSKDEKNIIKECSLRDDLSVSISINFSTLEQNNTFTLSHDFSLKNGVKFYLNLSKLDILNFLTINCKLNEIYKFDIDIDFNKIETINLTDKTDNQEIEYPVSLANFDENKYYEGKIYNISISTS